MMQLDWTQILTSVIAFLGGGGIAFFTLRQQRDKLDIENEASVAEQWKKLYEEQKADNGEKDKKIEELFREIKVLREKVSQLEREQIINSVYNCCKLDCPNRATRKQDEEQLHFLLKQAKMMPGEAPERG